MARGLAGFTQGAKVALFVVVLAVASWFIWRMVRKDTASGGGYTVYTHLKDATGLVPKSRVKIAGISVGYIDTISLDKDEAKVSIKIDKGVDLHTDATAAKRSSSLLGDQVLVLTPGTDGMPKIPDGGEIMNAQESASMDKIMNDLAVIADRVKQVSIQAADAFGTPESGEKMKQILSNLAEVSKEINETVKENRQSVRETIKNIEEITRRSEPKIDQILNNVSAVTGDFKSLMEANGQQLPKDSGMASVRDTLDQLNKASKNLDSTLHHADDVMARIDRGEGTLGRLTNDSTLIDEVEGVATDIHDFTSGISRLQTIVSLRGEYYVRSNGIKSYVELRLQPREDKYYMIELVNDPRGKVSITQDDIASTNPNDPPFYRRVTTETTNSLLISFMFARRLGPATFLFGLRESTGGVGLVLHGTLRHDDDVELASDLFGFGVNVHPHWRERLSWEFVRRLWIVAGLDDLLNADRRDWFFGAQLRFNDEDLKSILPFAPVKP